MKYPITQLWDSRLLYIYALLGDFISKDEVITMRKINSFINLPGNQYYCLSMLAKLENEAKIETLRVNIGSMPMHIPSSFKAKGKLDKLIDVVQQEETQVYVEVRAVNSRWFYKMVESYLQAFRSDMLLIPIGEPAQPYALQKTNLISKLRHSAVNRGILLHQAEASPRALETILSMALDGLVNIKSLQPKPVSQGFKFKTMMAMVKLTEKAAQESEIYEEEPVTIAEAKIDGTQIYVGIKGMDLLPLYNVELDGGLYHFMHYMQGHTNKDVGIGDITLLDGCDKYDNLTEVVRFCHFNKILKDIFFRGTKRKNVRFTAIKELEADQAVPFNVELDKLRKSVE